MTAAKENDDIKRERADHNRDRRLAFMRMIDQLIAAASMPGFTGNCSITFPTKDGRIGKGRKIIEEFES